MSQTRAERRHSWNVHVIVIIQWRSFAPLASLCLVERSSHRPRDCAGCEWRKETGLEGWQLSLGQRMGNLWQVYEWNTLVVLVLAARERLGCDICRGDWRNWIRSGVFFERVVIVGICGNWKHSRRLSVYGKRDRLGLEVIGNGELWDFIGRRIYFLCIWITTPLLCCLGSSSFCSSCDLFLNLRTVLLNHIG